MRNLGGTIVVASVLTLPLSQRYAGFMLIFWALLLLPWLAYSAYVVASKPAHRSNQLARISVWVVCGAVVVVAHLVWYVSSRRNADEIVEVVQSYMRVHGRCAQTLEDLGTTKEQLRAKVGVSHYYCDAGKPRFFYGDTFVAFDKYWYDFDRGVWEHKPD